MEGTTRTPKPNEFVLREREAYAMTDVNLWAAAEFIMTKLELVQLKDVDPDDRTCVICQKEYRVSDDKKPSHAPVKTPCGHVYGKSCIIMWLDPLCFYNKQGPAMGLEPTKTSCPTCRSVFYDVTNRLPLDAPAARLWYWDQVYARVGVARSEKEERSRKFLWDYVEYCRSVSDFRFPRRFALMLIQSLESLLAWFAIRLESQTLTPIQEGLRKNLTAPGWWNVREEIEQMEDNVDCSIISAGTLFITRKRTKKRNKKAK